MKNNNTSRTKNVTRNALVGIITQVFRILIEFIVRTIFIKKLGSEYLGVNGLFTNILTILSFAELGIGNAIVFNMYKEIANNNEDNIVKLMNLYKKSYRIIGLVIFVVGIFIMPFINFIISDVPSISENIYLLYFLFLMNTVSSYFFAYKKSIISAHQKEYIINIYRVVGEIIKAIFQIIVLVIWKNFILYLVIQIVCTLLENILVSLRANKMYTYLLNRNVEELGSGEKKSIFSNVKALVMYKFGSIILNGTDNIIISKMLGLITVGLVSNYNLLINTLTTLVSSLLNGFTASIGNLNTEKNIEKQEGILKQMLFLCTWIFGFCAIAFYVLVNDFIVIWVGKEYLVDSLSIFALVLHFYVNGVQFSGYTFRITMGLFKRGKYCPIIAAVINIILSILLCKLIGLAGIIFATSISRFLTTTWYDIYMVYKLKFEKKPYIYYLQYIKYLVVVLIVGFITYKVCSLITVGALYGFILKALVVLLIPNIMFLIIYYRTKEFKRIVERIKLIIWKKKAI